MTHDKHQEKGKGQRASLPPHPGWILVAMSLVLALIFINQTAVAVALPKMQHELGFSNVAQQWIVNLYHVTLTVGIIFGGKLGDMYGYRRIFFCGTLIFILSSLSCAFADAGWQVMASTGIQGVGGALMMPASAVIVFSAFCETKRGQAMGMYVAVASIFLAIGPLLGGLLTQLLSWRWVFAINVPTGLVSLIIAYFTVPGATKRRSDRHLDIVGFICQVLAISALVVALMQGNEWGWSSPVILSLFGLFMVSSGCFIYVEQRSQHPLVNLKIFKSSLFSTSVCILMMMQGVFIVIVYWAIFLQKVLQFSPFMAGLLLLPATLPIVLLAPVAGYIRDLYGPRLPIIWGTGLITVGALLVAIFAPTKTYAYLFTGFLCYGMGAPFVLSSAVTTALASVSETYRGMATGIATGARQLGSTLGLAVISAIILNRYHTHLGGALDRVDDSLSGVMVHHLEGILVNSSTSKALLKQLTEPQHQKLTELAMDAYIDGFVTAMYFLVMVSVAAFIIAWRMPITARRI